MAGFRISRKSVVDWFFRGEIKDLSRHQYVFRLLLFGVYWAIWLAGCFLVARGHWCYPWSRVMVTILLILTSPTELPFISYQRAKRWFSDEYRGEEDSNGAADDSLDESPENSEAG